MPKLTRHGRDLPRSICLAKRGCLWAFREPDRVGWFARRPRREPAASANARKKSEVKGPLSVATLQPRPLLAVSVVPSVPELPPVAPRPAVP